MWEYNLRMRAYRLRMVDKEYELHLAAWVDREVNAKRKSGKNGAKYIYAKWDQFFDYEKREAEILDEAQDEKPISIAEKLREYERKKKDGQL